MDKLIKDEEGKITVSNGIFNLLVIILRNVDLKDGATILKLLPVRHPVAHIMVDTSMSHDKEVW